MGSVTNLLDKDVFSLANYSGNFMESFGYEKANKMSFREKEFTSGGSFGAGERITTTAYTMEQVGSKKITYAKPEDMYKFENLKTKTDTGNNSSIETVTYNTKIPFGKDGTSNSYYSGNQISKGTSSFLSAVGSLLENFYKHNHR